MRLALSAVFLGSFACAPALAQEAAPGEAAPRAAVTDQASTTQPAGEPVYDEQAVGADQVAAALARAKKENRRVLIQWGANWCGWCIKLHELTRTNPEVKRELLYEYDLVHIDVGQFDKHMDLAAKYGADLKGNGIPFLTVLDAGGTPIANQETGSLENPAGATPAHDVEKVMAFLTEHRAEYQAASAILDDGLARAKAEGKTAFVHFGAPWCGWCHRLEAFLVREDIAPLMDKRFVDIKIDTDRTIGGGDMLVEMCGTQRSGIPWFAFMDGAGKTVATSSDEGQNIGFPVAPEEIAAFMGMLRKVTPPLAEDELATIETALREGEKKPG